MVDHILRTPRAGVFNIRCFNWNNYILEKFLNLSKPYKKYLLEIWLPLPCLGYGIPDLPPTAVPTNLGPVFSHQ